MKWIKSRLDAKLALIILLHIFAFVGGISLILYQRSVSSLEQEAYGRLEQMVHAYGNELDIAILNTMQITDTLETLVQEDFSLEKVKDEAGYLDGQIRRFDPYVKAIAQDFSMANTAYIYYNWELDGGVHDVYYADHDGDGTVSRQEQLPVQYYGTSEAKRGSRDWWFGPIESHKGYWSPIYKWIFDDNSSELFLSYTKAVFSEGTLVGVVGTDFKYENLLVLMKGIKVYDTGYPFLINENGGFLIHPKEEGEFLSTLKAQPYTTLRERVSSESKGVFRFEDGDGKPWVIAHRRLQNNWTLGIAAPIPEVIESAISMTYLVVGLLLMAVPLIGAASVFASRRITLPIHELTDTVRRIEAGDYKAQISPDVLGRLDELGRLGNAVQNMGASLQANMNEIRMKNEQLQNEISEKQEIWNNFNIQTQSIEFLKGHDPQTGLLNKPAMMEMVQKYLDDVVSENDIAALISLNIDDFRLINEAMGYDCGDAVIEEICTRFKRIIGEEDLLARTAGDEFIVFIKRVDHLREIENLASELLETAKRPVRCGERELFTTISLGIAVYPFDSRDLDHLMVCSAAALNNAKATGKNAARFYAQEMTEQAFERYELSNQLREALERDEFYLLYQPIISLPDRRIQSAEALIRWRHPTKGIIGPDRFIPLAESTGIICPLGDWVFEEVCSQLKQWDSKGIPKMHVSVNLSAVQLNDPHLWQRVESILDFAGIDGSRLNVEITETVLMLRNGHSAENLARLKDLGMRIHMDDFGTGFSSLAYLRDFHIDVLKIDKTFIGNIPDKDSGDIARLIIDLSKSLGISVIAEGVETEEQLEFLLRNGCTNAQGYLIGRPVPPEEFAAQLG